MILMICILLLHSTPLSFDWNRQRSEKEEECSRVLDDFVIENFNGQLKLSSNFFLNCEWWVQGGGFELILVLFFL